MLELLVHFCVLRYQPVTLLPPPQFNVSVNKISFVVLTVSQNIFKKQQLFQEPMSKLHRANKLQMSL